MLKAFQCFNAINIFLFASRSRSERASAGRNRPRLQRKSQQHSHCSVVSTKEAARIEFSKGKGKEEVKEMIVLDLGKTVSVALGTDAHGGRERIQEES